MKKLQHLTLTALIAATSLSWGFESVDFQADLGVSNNYIFRGVQRSDNTAYDLKLGWKKDGWSGSFHGIYDTGSTSFITDYDSNWMEWRSNVEYAFEKTKSGTWSAGYTYYAFYDSYFDTHEVSLKYRHNGSWNPTLAVHADVDFNSGLYYEASVSRSKRDREWEYGFGVSLGYHTSHGENFTDAKTIRGTVFQNPYNNAGSRSGVADLRPQLNLTRHLDDESSITVHVGSSLILDKANYLAADMADDELQWGVNYSVKF